MTSTFTPDPGKHSGHLFPLDGIRGLAILMVLGSHLFASNSAMSGRVTRFVGDFMGYGHLGVDLFFALSGFLITGVLVDGLDDPHFFKNFYIRRVLRIFPLYYGVLIVLFALTPLLALRWHGMAALFTLYLQTLHPAELSRFSPGSGISLSHFWSLAIEEQFYMVWPAVVFWVRDRRALLLTTLGCSAFALALRLVLVGAGVEGLAIHMATITRADSLLLGGTLALLYRSNQWGRVLKIAPFGFFATAVVVCASIKFFDREFLPSPPYSLPMRFWVDGARYTVVGFGATCLIAWSLRPASACRRFFEGRTMRFFGKYSYGIYVLHVLLLPVLLGRQRAAIEHLTHNKLLAVAGAGFSTLLLSIAAAVVSFHFYEKPFLRLKRFFHYHPERKPPLNLRVMSPRRTAADLVSSEDRVRAVSLR